MDEHFDEPPEEFDWFTPWRWEQFHPFRAAIYLVVVTAITWFLYAIIFVQWIE